MLIHQQKEINQFLKEEQITICSSLFWKRQCENLKNGRQNFFQLVIHSDPVRLRLKTLLDSFGTLGLNERTNFKKDSIRWTVSYTARLSYPI